MQGLGYQATEGTRPKRKPAPAAAGRAPRPPRGEPGARTRPSPTMPVPAGARRAGAPSRASVPDPPTGQPDVPSPDLPEMPEPVGRSPSIRGRSRIRRRPPARDASRPIAADGRGRSRRSGVRSEAAGGAETETFFTFTRAAAAGGRSAPSAGAAEPREERKGKPQPPRRGRAQGQAAPRAATSRKGKREGPREEQPARAGAAAAAREADRPGQSRSRR